MSVKRGLRVGVAVFFSFSFFFLIFVFAFFFLFPFFHLFSLLSSFLYDNNGNNQRLETNYELRAEYHGMVLAKMVT